MATLEQRFSAYVAGSASSTPVTGDAFQKECLAEAAALVNREIRGTGVEEPTVPLPGPGMSYEFEVLNGAIVGQAIVLTDGLIPAGYTGTITVPSSSVVTPVTSGVPLVIWERAVLSCAADLYYRKQAKGGISQFATPDGSPMRLRHDPMAEARALLAPFLPAGFA